MAPYFFLLTILFRTGIIKTKKNFSNSRKKAAKFLTVSYEGTFNRQGGEQMSFTRRSVSARGATRSTPRPIFAPSSSPAMRNITKVKKVSSKSGIECIKTPPRHTIMCRGGVLLDFYGSFAGIKVSRSSSGTTRKRSSFIATVFGSPLW